jgi:CRISPR system Cascade subunit CasA
MELPGTDFFSEPWIPLDVDGRPRYVSFVELLAGEVDAEELLHPRDDMRFFARMLLSAMAQAAFDVPNSEALRQHLAQPLSRGQVEAAIEPLRSLAEPSVGSLFHTPGPDEGDNATGYLFLDVPSGTNHTLYRPATSVEALCGSCAVIAAFGLQAFAAQGGQGKSPGVRGAPPPTTLLWRKSVRQSVWANVLTAQTRQALGYPTDQKTPWVAERKEKPAGTVGLVEGLFWQPRAITFAPREAAACDICGREGDRWSVVGFKRGSKVTPPGIYRHPMSPSVETVTRQGAHNWRYARLKAGQPAWTGLAEILSSTRGGRSGETQIIHAAPVVTQWIEGLDERHITLLLIAYRLKQAKVLGRFAEMFTLSMDDQHKPLSHVIASLVSLAEATRDLLTRALRAALGHARPTEAESRFWQETEAAFREALAAEQEGRDSYPAFSAALRGVARRIFDETTDPIAVENTRQAPVARARGRLVKDLWHTLAPLEAANGNTVAH